MSRLYDKLMAVGLGIDRAQGRRAESPAERAHGLAKEAPVFVLDNVMDYALSMPGPRWNFQTDIPNVAPPFPVYFVEAKPSFEVLKKAGEGGPVFQRLGNVITIGALVESWTTEEIRTSRQQREAVPPLLAQFSRHPLAHWVSSIYVMANVGPGNSPVLLGYQVVAIGADGQILGSEPGALAAHTECLMGAPGSALYEEYMDFIPRALFPLLLGVSFLHCKNVVTVPHEPSPQAVKRFQKRYGTPLVRYHTLSITPMTQVLRSEGRADSEGLSQALHICRGHFKTYSERGLFGNPKMTGTFWIPQHLRGSKSEGVVVKDYKVNPPKEP